jgi:hypothetical protein
MVVTRGVDVYGAVLVSAVWFINECFRPPLHYKILFWVVRIIFAVFSSVIMSCFSVGSLYDKTFFYLRYAKSRALSYNLVQYYAARNVVALYVPYVRLLDPNL